MKIEPGQFVVISNRYSYGIERVERTTAQKVYYLDGHYKRERQCFKEAVVFSGAEEIARRLCERLTSSLAQCEEEGRNSYRRKMERNERFIREAWTEAGSPQ